MNEAYIFDALRTPRGKGKASGSLYELKPVDLLSATLNSLQSRLDLDTSQVDDFIAGCVTPIGEQGGNIAKAALLNSAWDNGVGGMQINRFCASGLEAVNLAAARIRAGFDELIVAGGVESMSRVPMGSDAGALMHDPEVSAKVNYVPQGISADLIATIQNFDRKTVDQYALRSQQRAGLAQEQGYFSKSLIPIKDENGLLILEKDEYPRPSTTAEALASLQPAFTKLGDYGFDSMALQKYAEVERINHVHTAGNSSGIVDGAAVVLVGSKEKGEALGLKPRARICSAASISTEPTIMLQGPTPAALKALRIAGMKRSDIDLWEINEAFASVVLKFQRDLEVPDDLLNVNGGAIALGHPLGATGAMILGTILDELERRNLNAGLVGLCVGGGMGVATIIERV